MKQAYRPERPTPLQIFAALAGLTIAAAIVLVALWFIFVTALTSADVIADSLR